MKPEFSMLNDDPLPEVKSFLASWKHKGGETIILFSSTKEAFAMDDVVKNAYIAGLDDGRKESLR